MAWSRQLNHASDESMMFRDELLRHKLYYEQRLALIDEEIATPQPRLSMADLDACSPPHRAWLLKRKSHREIPVAELRTNTAAFLDLQLKHVSAEMDRRQRAAQHGALDVHPNGRVPQEVIDRIKHTISLAGAVEETGVRLGPPTASHERRGACPFCDVKSQPFVVHEANPHDEWWHCHACNHHGDVIDFSSYLYDLPFRDAVLVLAQRCGLDWPPRPSDRTGDLLARARGAHA